MAGFAVRRLSSQQDSSRHSPSALCSCSDSMETTPHRVAPPQEPRRCSRAPSPRLVVVVVGLLVLASWLSERLVTRPRPTLKRVPVHDTASRLWDLASRRIVEPRGVVMPLFDDIAPLGISLIMELRALHVDLPIEIPHCGDLGDEMIAYLERNVTTDVRVYDVCSEAAAANEVDPDGGVRPLFCPDLGFCQRRFQSFYIKIIAVFFSRFAEVMMVDADVMFFKSPSSLWDLQKYTRTGTLFFTDRISSTHKYLSKPYNRAYPEHSKLHQFVETFNRAPFRELENVPRTDGKTEKEKPSDRQFWQRGEPSEYLKNTHVWNLRAGHHADSSVMLWNKKKQPRATAILGSFLTLNHAHRPPSYGDKELYFLACEVADSDYAFSDFGVASVGWDARSDDGILCGDVLHYYPARSEANENDFEDAQALYINSDHIMSWKPDEKDLYRSNARPASHYPGSFEERNLTQECPFDIVPIPLSNEELECFRRRQQFYEIAQCWQTGTSK